MTGQARHSPARARTAYGVALGAGEPSAPPPPRPPTEASRRRAPRGRRFVDALGNLPSDQGSRWLLVGGVVGLMVFLVVPVVALTQERQPTPDELFAFGCIAAFVALYLWAIPATLSVVRGSGRHGPRSSWHSSAS